MRSRFDEERCLSLLAAGKAREAAELLVRGLGDAIHGYLVGLLRDDEEANDAYSMWEENAWKGLVGFRGESSLRLWSYRLARNAALRLRDEAWRRRGRRLRTSEASLLADRARRSSLARHDAWAAKLAKLRQTLAPEDQSLLRLRLDEDLSWREIAELLRDPGSGPATEQDAAACRQRFHRIKKKLEALARRDGLLD
jgi:RNA polymerase sigma-70 factor (ECF subfamily)